ncbi:MAG TPA: thioredoxin domain-containing protein [Clostridiales bacterium]|jgi:thioredoxin 1|nr:thioredoxin domain-containing protein [Clostridiales bacterium]HQP71029.1 thioredoxin domain-containing protein [Clostridiales bacterium]
MPAIKVNSRNFKKEILESEIPAAVNFYADWCFQCKIVDPLIDDLADEYKGKFKIAQLNYDQNKTFSKKHKITSIPTIVIFIGGEEKERFEEVDPEKDFNAIFDKYLKKKTKKAAK